VNANKANPTTISWLLVLFHLLRDPQG
jgi:hypothetical protein